MKINFIQDIASPHNNVFIQALEEDQSIDLSLWYCVHNPEMYGWKEDLTNAIKPANMYKQKSIDFKFLWHCLKNTKEKYLVVGWQNINTKLLMLLFFITRRSYAVWFDLPNDERERNFVKRFFRNFFYFILKHSNAHVFGVGQMTLDYFKSRGFKEKHLTNLPIFVDVSKNPEDYRKNKADIFKKYNVTDDGFLLSAGSRLIYEKGFDILIDAIAKLPDDIKSKVKCVIVGKGEEEENLKAQIKKNGLSDIVVMEPWMEFDTFCALIASSYLFIHPCRFDAYGGTTIAHSLSTPVLGSVGAGAAYDRIINGENGYLYENNSANELARLIVQCYNAPNDVKTMAKKARLTAEKWSPEMGVRMIEKGMI